MKQPSFLEGVGVAVAASLAGTVLYAALAHISPGGALRFVVAALGLGYLFYLLARSSDRVGRIVVVAAWTLMAALT